MTNKRLIGILAGLYLLVMVYFAFRPFRPIRGLQYAPADLAFADGAVHVQRDAALEDRRGGKHIREALMQTGQLSIEACLQTDSLKQVGAANIFGYARGNMNRNFSLGQEGNALDFRLRTTRTDHGGLRGRLIVPQSLDTNRVQHVVVTYDGDYTALYVDGILRAESDELNGGFKNWGRDQVLLLGDLPPGGDGWAGHIWRVALYDRTLTAGEAKRLAQDEEVPGAVLAYDFDAVTRKSGLRSMGLRPLHYRNLFVMHDEIACNLDDCFFNIAGFIPLGIFVYLLLPERLEQRRLLAAVVIPLLFGGAASLTIECLQRYIMNRVPCAPDLVYNLTGALIGGLLGWLAMSNFKNKTTNGSAT